MSEAGDMLVKAADPASAEPLSRIDRVAVFLMLLSDDLAVDLLARLGPDELERIGTSMCALGEVDEGAMTEALDDFVLESSREVITGQDRSVQVRSLFERSLGPTKAESMMLRIEPDARPRTIEMARWLAPSVLLKLVEDEHPQVIAALLLLLDPDPAAQVLSELPGYIQPTVVERVASMGNVSAKAVAMIDALLSQRIGASFGASALSVGGPREAAQLINLAAGEVRGTVLPAIAQRNATLAEKIEEELFTFEMLFDLEPKDMGVVLRDVDSEVLIDALKGISEEEREFFYRAMSSRAANGIKDEIELRGRLTRSEVDAAQRKVVELARKLADTGEIILGGDDGEFV
ncbi:flagellar motor switch protein FliG [Erythrobacter sp. KY5]|uniref:flagellar motor switch protein FliG n=1 Tax=Erythrobacter sp. KY5 TaxID=2011159 RepID=UPI000DBF1CE1|nr:FliG C-terminal domain-containing protein [Erythrobacter sp. KY5]AWW73560.1 flagellar motor switch protein FliG [Erythrobacter sp. KY5]